MLESLARFDIRFRWIIVAVWIVGAVAASRLLPSLASVTQSSNAVFLPASAPSQHAASLAAPFKTSDTSATATIIASRSDAVLSTADDVAISRIEQDVSSLPGVRSLRDQGSSADGHARRALVVTDPVGGNSGNPGLVSSVRGTFGTVGVPDGLSFHLTGPLAQATDAAATAAQTGTNIRIFSVLFVIVLLFLVYRSALAPLVTLLPALLSLLAAGPLIARASQGGLTVSPATQTLLPVLLLGAGTDYGLFLVYRVREEIRRGATPPDALVAAMGRVGLSITYSALTVIAALACLLLASFALYQGLGPSLAIGVAVMLAAALTLLPALLAIFGRAVFWPSSPAAGQATMGVWGRVATRVVRRPLVVLLGSVVVFGTLTAGLAGFTAGGFTSSAPTGSDTAAGAAAIAAHFPAASSNPETLLMRFAKPVWEHPETLSMAQDQLKSAPELRAVSGPLNPNGTQLTAQELASLHAQLGPAAALPPVPETHVAGTYQAYRATAQFISPDGRTVQFDALIAAGSAGSQAAINSIPVLRSSLATVANAVGAQDSGVLGPDAVAYDVGHTSTNDLLAIAPVVLAALAILLAVLLRSLIAPIYLIATVGLSYLAALGAATLVFIHVAGDGSINFVIPILLFIFAMALGEDYNILLMTRVREEAHDHGLKDALIRAIGNTGGTITSAGLVLAGTFTVLAIAGNSGQSRQLGFTIAFAVLLDTFFVRTLLVPSIAILLGRWNWWPSALSRPSARPASFERPQTASSQPPASSD
jgi:putative drug exporter of the RND superfamily